MTKISAYIIAILIILIPVFGFEFLKYKIDKKICENNGGKYIFSLNQYETKCHYVGEEEK